MMTVNPTSRTTSTGSLRSSSRTKSPVTTPPAVEGVEELGPYTFDADGDLRLEVGTAKVNPLTFVVCSRTLARASPVFKTMLYGPYAEGSRRRRRSSPSDTSCTPKAAPASPSAYLTPTSTPPTPPESDTTTTPPPQQQDQDHHQRLQDLLGGDEWTVELPDDDPRAFRTLMGIIHSAFEHVPESLGLMELFQVAILTDKYDMTHLLRPWAAAWCAPHRAKRHPYRLWIAWVLGDARMFESEARRLVQTCPVNADGQLLVRCTNGSLLPLETFDYLRVPDILESIAASRFDAADQILQHLFSTHKILATANGSHCKETLASLDTRLDCENALLGSTVKALDAAELWPLPSTPLLTFSLDALATKVGRATQVIRPLNSPSAVQHHHHGQEKTSGKGGDGSARQHAGCNPAAALDAAVKRIMAGVPSPVQHYHLAHLAAQAEKSGLGMEKFAD